MKKQTLALDSMTGRLSLSQLDKIIKEDLKTRAWWALEDIEIAPTKFRSDVDSSFGCGCNCCGPARHW